MSATNSFSIAFVQRLDKKDKAKGTLFARITVNGETKEISIKEKIPVSQWNAQAEMAKGQSAEVKSLNKYIEGVRFRLTEISGPWWTTSSSFRHRE
jgi:hypothetical protein